MKIDYHMNKLEQVTCRIVEDPSGAQIQKLFEQKSKHLEALVELGEFEKRTFELQYVPKDSERSDEFHDEIFKRFQRDPIFPIWSDLVRKTDAGETSLHTITVWDTPDQMIKWAKFILEFDILQKQ